MRTWSVCLLVLATLPVVDCLAADTPPGEGPALRADRLDQAAIASARTDLEAIRIEGLRLFSTPLNRHDGYGDGPSNGGDPLEPGSRPTLQGNGTLLRINGLDAQSCLECHSIVRASTMPPILGIGGVGGSNSNVLLRPRLMDMEDRDGDGAVDFDGRFANPPFLFGAGGIELLAIEMTQDLQRLKARALAAPGVPVDLETKGVWFGRITADADGRLDVTELEGVRPDLVVRPFGRKGEFATAREFDIGAMSFHFGMQPSEVVGHGVDDDGDGVADEIRPGDLSALHAFAATLEHPIEDRRDDEARRGARLFREVGCAGCHRPSLETRRRTLPLRFPEVPAEPLRNVYRAIDLGHGPWAFDRTRRGGLRVPLFSDLKRHDMGEALQEDFAGADDEENRTFVTARLWGVADTAPYLHDGRATTLSDAILQHGGEAQPVRDRFEDLSDADRRAILAFLRTLRTPEEPARKLVRAAQKQERKDARGRGRGASPGHAGDGPEEGDEARADRHEDRGKHGKQGKRKQASRGRPSWFRLLMRWLLR